jgi:four helix bundle protein
MSEIANPVLTKSYAFALRIIRLYHHLTEEKHEFLLSKNVFTNGTEIGAYVKSAQDAESKPIFYQEMGIAFRKASRTEYWLKLLFDTGFLGTAAFESIHADCLELLRMLSSITKTTRESL